MLIPLIAGAALAGALAFGLAALIGAGPMRVGLPWVGLRGGVAFGVDPMRATIMAFVLLAAAASLLAAPAPRGRLVGLIVTTVPALLALDPFAAWFLGLSAALVALLWRSRDGFALAALPAIGLVLVIKDAPVGLASGLAITGMMVMTAAGIAAVRTLDLARLARAVALGFAGLALLGAGLGGDRAAVMAVLANATIAPLVGIVANTLDGAAGTRSMDWLGGLARGMPRFSLMILAGMAFAALLPPGPGFAAFSAVWRTAVAHSSVLAVLVMALWAGLMGFACLRSFGMICLGRPRSLRAAAAEDVAGTLLTGLGLLVFGGVIIGGASPDMLALTVSMAGLGMPTWRYLTRAGPLDIAAFDDGFARAPAWLPFGDPATQINASGFAAKFRLPSILAARLHRAAALLREAWWS